MQSNPGGWDVAQFSQGIAPWDRRYLRFHAPGDAGTLGLLEVKLACAGIPRAQVSARAEILRVQLPLID